MYVYVLLYRVEYNYGFFNFYTYTILIAMQFMLILSYNRQTKAKHPTPVLHAQNKELLKHSTCATRLHVVHD